MRTFLLILCGCIFMIACKNAGEKTTGTHNEQAQQVFGAAFSDSNGLDALQMAEKFSRMQVSDTLDLAFTATVIDVCQAKGCWMKLNLENGEEVMVTFKDYGFFVPKTLKAGR